MTSPASGFTQELLHGGVFVVGEIVQHQLREEFRLDERHRYDYTSVPDYVRDVTLIELFTQW